MKRFLLSIIAMAMIFMGPAYAGPLNTLAGASPASMDDVVAMDGVYSMSGDLLMEQRADAVASSDCVFTGEQKSVTQTSALPKTDGMTYMPVSISGIGAGHGGDRLRDQVRRRSHKPIAAGMSGSSCGVCHNRLGST